MYDNDNDSECYSIDSLNDKLTQVQDYYLNDNKHKFTCNICNDTNGMKENYVILSCNHVFHINCLAETHFADIYKFPVLDNEYFSNRSCTSCNTKLENEEIMYLHSKFLSTTKNYIAKHQQSIEHLEYQLNQLKTELRVCYDYKHKLEAEREKSKQIVSILATCL
jgi:hypothetical protein